MSERGRNGDREKTYPTHTVSFARIVGKDDDGKDVLGPARQVGAIWPRVGKEGDGIQRFDHIPEEMRSHGGGVLFVREYKERGPRKNRDRGESDQGRERD